MLFVECKSDYVLVTMLSSREVEHAGNKSGVIQKLIRSRGRPNYENSTGMIDEDPLSNQNPDLGKFTKPEILNKAEIKVLHYRWLNNSLIILCPKLEEWIIAAAKEARIRMIDYDLPDSPEALHGVINLRTDQFEALVNSLRRRSARVTELQRLLRKSARRTSLK